MKLQIVQYLYSGFDNILMSISQILIFIFGGSMVLNKKMTAGEFTILSAYYNIAISSIRYFFDIGKQYQNVKVSYSRIQNLYNEPEEQNGSLYIKDINSIGLDKIDFSYNNKKIFNSFSYTFSKGNSYSVVGLNGSGKTTLLMIILGLFQPNSGEVKINNISIKNLNMSEIRAKDISVIEQNPTIINGTIISNINIINNDINNQSTEKLLKNMELYINNKRLSEILNMEINDDIENISGGEKQKIGIARALIKPASIYIMDEPTSSLDKESNYFIKTKIKELAKDAIVIVVTHDEEISSICDYCINL